MRTAEISIQIYRDFYKKKLKKDNCCYVKNIISKHPLSARHHAPFLVEVICSNNNFRNFTLDALQRPIQKLSCPHCLRMVGNISIQTGFAVFIFHSISIRLSLSKWAYCHKGWIPSQLLIVHWKSMCSELGTLMTTVLISLSTHTSILKASICRKEPECFCYQLVYLCGISSITVLASMTYINVCLFMFYGKTTIKDYTKLSLQIWKMLRSNHLSINLPWKRVPQPWPHVLHSWHKTPCSNHHSF